MISKLILGAAFTALVSAGSANAVIVNIDSIANATPTNPSVMVLLGAGTYTVTPVSGAYTAFTRFSTVSGCDGAGENCSTGFEHSYVITINGVSTGYGDGNANGTIGPISPGNGYYATLAQAFAGATGTSFTLAAPTTVGFSVFDDFLSDNSGGISLNVSAVPEPATWALLIGGFIMVGFAARRRRQSVTA